jgi:hypothetical protein
MNDFQIQTGRYPSGFRHLASAMRKNSVRQHEFATLLRVLSCRFGSNSTERRMLHQAAATARCKENKLRKLLANLGWSARVKRPRTRRFLTCFELAKSAPVPVTIFLLTLSIAKPVRGQVFDHFYPWKSPQPVKGSTHSLPRPLVRHSLGTRDEGGSMAKTGPTAPY